jgi:hypothetical protein
MLLDLRRHFAKRVPLVGHDIMALCGLQAPMTQEVRCDTELAGMIIRHR